MCDCYKRGQAIRRGVSSLANGNVKAVVTAAAYVGRSMARDVQSGALKSAALNRLAQIRKPR
jgi:hypothetical protein